LHFIASMISGLITTAASMPVDIAKTRSDVPSLLDVGGRCIYVITIAFSQICGMITWLENSESLEISIVEFDSCWEKSVNSAWPSLYG